MTSTLPFVAAIPLSEGLAGASEENLASLARASVCIIAVERNERLPENWVQSISWSVEDVRPSDAPVVTALRSDWQGSYLVVR
jgi:hypothetical protein